MISNNNKGLSSEVSTEQPGDTRQTFGGRGDIHRNAPSLPEAAMMGPAARMRSVQCSEGTLRPLAFILG